ncbi:MAG TPA: hypothetical protein VMT30_09515 [Candidatus Saccharimonadia bacterium]|nr:hypothetical protein [Candidatus Saccharimonadia bacterium]
MIGYLVWAIDMIRGSSTRGLELQNGMAAVASGVVLILPASTFSTSPSYRLFDAAPESIWGLSLLGAGVAQIAAALHDTVPLRRIAATVLGVLFTALGLGILWANPLSAVAPIMLALAAGQVGAFWQARWVR